MLVAQLTRSQTGNLFLGLSSRQEGIGSGSDFNQVSH